MARCHGTQIKWTILKYVSFSEVFKRKKKVLRIELLKKKKKENCKKLKSTEDFVHMKQHPIKQTSEPALTN